MGWYTEMIFLLLIRYTMANARVFDNINLPQNVVDEDIPQSIDNPGKEEPLALVNPYEDVKLAHLGKLLANVLLEPWPRGVSPVLYIENTSENIHEDAPVESAVAETEGMSNSPFKRSRYYRKYPWKRQNSRYDAENRYLCQPSKEDVFRLLVALHEARQGNRGQMINFCNRKRPASAIFTNIRFLG